jgi:prepilin-type N-terminal cleavage/methylation domain-containing protein
MNTHKNIAGFTLIEMLVALTIIAAILAMLYGSYAATTRSIEASNTRMACLERAGFALRLMTRQIRCAYAPPANPGPSESTPPGSQRLGATTDAGRLNDAAGILPVKSCAWFRGDCRDSRGEILSFVTGSGPGADPNARRGLVRVTYEYDEIASTLSMHSQDYAGAFDGGPISEPVHPVLRNVTSVVLRFHDGRQWQDTWQANQKRGLPRAVKMEIVVMDEAGRSHHLGTTVPIGQRTRAEPESARQTAAAGQL